MVGHIERGRQNRAAVLELLGRFPAMTASQVAAILFGGRLRPANRVLLSLHRAGRLHRVPTGSEYAYSLRKPATAQLDHHLAIAGLYAALVRGARGAQVTGAANVQLCQGLITDLLAVTPGLAVLAEVHRGTNPFGTKLERYADYRESREWQRAPWWVPEMRVVVWLVGPAAAIPWLDRAAQPYRAAGMRVVATDLAAALRDPWGALGAAVAQPPASTAGAIRWSLPTRRSADA